MILHFRETILSLLLHACIVRNCIKCKCFGPLPKSASRRHIIDWICAVCTDLKCSRMGRFFSCMNYDNRCKWTARRPSSKGTNRNKCSAFRAEQHPTEEDALWHCCIYRILIFLLCTTIRTAIFIIAISADSGRSSQRCDCRRFFCFRFVFVSSAGTSRHFAFRSRYVRWTIRVLHACSESAFSVCETTCLCIQ